MPALICGPPASAFQTFIIDYVYNLCVLLGCVCILCIQCPQVPEGLGKGSFESDAEIQAQVLCKTKLELFLGCVSPVKVSNLFKVLEIKSRPPRLLGKRSVTRLHFESNKQHIYVCTSRYECMLHCQGQRTGFLYHYINFKVVSLLGMPRVNTAFLWCIYIYLHTFLDWICYTYYIY